MISKLVIVMMIILGVCQLQLLGEIKATGKFLIPIENGFKSYDAVITITAAEIGVECALKIFQPFNEFDAPKQKKIKFNTAEVDRLWLDGDEIIILPRRPLYRRYRNLFHHIGLVCWICDRNKTAILFILDNPADISIAGEELIQAIDDKQKQTSHGFTGGFKGYVFNQ